MNVSVVTKTTFQLMSKPLWPFCMAPATLLFADCCFMYCCCYYIVVVPQVARRVAPCVICFDDAHMNFPNSNTARMSDAGGAAAVAKMAVELQVQLQQLADMQAHLEAAASAQPHQQQQKSIGSSSSSSAAAATSRSSQKGSSSGGGGGSGTEGSALRPVWGFFGCKSKSKKQQEAAAAASKSLEHQQQQQQSAYTKMGGPVVVVFVTQRPGDLDQTLLQQLPVQLLLGLPASDAREDLLMGWLMEREAAVNVQDVEWLAR